MDKYRSLITGATGLIGTRLVHALGSDVAVLSRDARKAEQALGVKAFAWNGTGAVPPEALEGVDTVFHLAGETVTGRWNDAKKERIRASRVDGTRALVQSIAGKPITLVSASAVGFYGDRGDEILDEGSPAGSGFLADVCRVWEAEAAAHTGRVASVRIGVVLAKDGGALAAMLPLFKTGLAGRLGDGKQYMPWIHIEDLVALFLHVARTDASGPVNGTAPNPVTNITFTKTLGEQLHRPTLLPAPKLALKLALGEMSQIVLASQRAIPKKALAAGFPFRFTELAQALADVLA